MIIEFLDNEQWMMIDEITSRQVRLVEQTFTVFSIHFGLETSVIDQRATTSGVSIL